MASLLLQKSIILYTDSSDFGISAVLAEEPICNKQVVCYASKALSKPQSKSSATRRKLMEIVIFTQHFRHYLIRRHFTVVADYRALQWLHFSENPDGRTAHCLENLAHWDYETRHRPGKSTLHKDGLSGITRFSRSVSEAMSDNNALVKAEKADDAPNHVQKKVPEGHVPKQNDLQGLLCLGWQKYNQLPSLYLKDKVLYRRLGPLDLSLPLCQHIIPRFRNADIVTFSHSWRTDSHRIRHKVINKIRERQYWPRFRE